MGSVTFCFPYRGVGGVPMQFARLSKELVARGREVFVVDYPDGCMARNIDDPRISRIAYEDHRPVRLPRDTIAVFQTMTPWSIFPSLRIDPDTRVLFWNCHPFNLVPTVPGLRHIVQAGPRLGRAALRLAVPRYWRQARRFLEILRAHRAIAFMDRGNVAVTELYLGIDLRDSELLPIPIAIPPETDARTLASTKALRVGWVGRVVDFKYHVLRRALHQLDAVARETGCAISVAIVGDGAYLRRLQRQAARLEHLAVEFRGRLDPASVDEFLRTQTDILLGMGTAALEGASHSVPTVLLDFSYRPVPEDYRFGWLHETDGYSLGMLIGAELRGDSGSMHRLITDALSRYGSLAVASRAYAVCNHAVAAVSDRLLELVARSSCTWRHLQSAGVLERGWLYRAHRSMAR